MYRLNDYLAMLSDERRVSAYTRAVEAQVKPGDRVIELGAGFGFFAVLAVRAGAAFVDAVDLNPIVHLGPRIAAVNGCADRIRFHQADLLRFTPERPADVIVGDLRGPTPFARRSLEVMIDARKRMLRKGGRLIGTKDTLFVAPARRPAAFRRVITEPLDRCDVNLSPVSAIMMDTPFPCTVDLNDLLVPGASWGAIDYERIDTANHTGGAEWRATETLHVEGLAIWFEADLGAGVGFTTAPGGSVTTYGQVFLPLREPVRVESAEYLRVELGARCSAGEYFWTWKVQVRGSDGAARICHAQNSLAERVVDPAAFGAAAL